MRGIGGTKIRKNISLRKSDWLLCNPVSHGRLPMSKTKVADEILHCKGVMEIPGCGPFAVNTPGLSPTSHPNNAAGWLLR
jgi:hypothetical protein